METNSLKTYVDLYNSVQNIRTGMNNRMSQANGRNQKVTPNAEFVDFCKTSISNIELLERSILENSQVNDMLLNNELKPMYVWLTANRGIGHIRACGLLAYIYPISRFNSVSDLWAYAGYGVVEVCQTCGKKHIDYNRRQQWIEHMADRLDMQNQRRIRATKATRDELLEKAVGYLCSCDEPDIKKVGQKRLAGQIPDFNPSLKKQLYLCVDQFIKLKNPNLYKRFYQETKANYMERPDLKAEIAAKKRGTIKGTGHIENMTRRKVAKLFLSHIFEIWNEIEGRTARKAYVFDVMGHKDMIEPEISLKDIDHTNAKVTARKLEERFQYLMKNPPKDESTDADYIDDEIDVECDY